MVFGGASERCIAASNAAYADERREGCFTLLDKVERAEI